MFLQYHNVLSPSIKTYDTTQLTIIATDVSRHSHRVDNQQAGENDGTRQEQR